jgi:hypothetical protein
MSIFSGLMNQTIDYIYSSTTDGWGDITLATLYSAVPCRFQERIGRLVDETKDVIEYKVEAWIDNSYTIDQDYEVKKGTRTYRVVKYVDQYDLFGNKDHIKLFLE